MELNYYYFIILVYDLWGLYEGGVWIGRKMLDRFKLILVYDW